jgi:protocatechuate 3,4-dioxygenase beta subunit
MNLLNTKTFERPDEHRRRLLRLAAVGSVFATHSGAFAEELTRTFAQTEGPFFPDNLPLDTDNDLLIINDALDPSVGEVTWLSGRVLDTSGTPLRNVLVEIWQCDANGAYLHSGSGNADNRDANFQGYGRFVTGLEGSYGFRTIKPVPYPGRTPHIHFKLSRGGQHLLTTQCYINGHAQNDRDGIYQRIPDDGRRASVTVDFTPVEGSRIGELAAGFDIVVGLTPEDA